MAEVDAAVGIQFDRHHRRVAQPPGDLVRVMFVGPHEHDRLMLPAEPLELAGAILAQEPAETAVEEVAGRRRDGHAEHLLQLDDGAGRAGAAGDDAPAGAGIDGSLDEPLGLLQQAGGAAPGDVVLGVGVGVGLQQALQVALDEQQRPSGGRVVAIDHQALAERRRDGGIGADDLAAELGGVEQLGQHVFAPWGPDSARES